MSLATLVLGISLVASGFSSEVPADVLSAYHTYSENVLTKTDFANQASTKHISAVCTFTLGYLLAVARENTFSINTAGFSEALSFADENLTNGYSEIAASFLEDSNVRSTSTIYTDVTNVTVPPGISKLSTTVYDVDFQNGAENSSETINERIANGTNGAILKRLIPSAENNQTKTDQYSPFCKSTRAVYANTFYYKNKFVQSFTELGERPFFSSAEPQENVSTLEASGSYSVFRGDSYSAVSVPLEGERKRIIFIQPNKSLEEFLQNNITDIFRIQPATWSSEEIRIQIPAIRFLLARNYDQQFRQLGIKNTFCEREGNSSEHFLTPPVQVISVAVTATDYELTVANAVQVNNLKAYLEEFPSALTPVASEEEHVVKNARSDVERQGFVFDRPFFVYLHDNILGATSFAAISSTRPFTIQEDRSPRHHEDPQDFTQATIRHRYEC